MTDYVENNFYMYGPAIGPSGNASYPITFIYENDDLIIYMIQDGKYTKMVSNKEHVRHYSGLLKDFDFNKWNNYNISGIGCYKIKNYGDPFRIKIIRENIIENFKLAEDKDICKYIIDNITYNHINYEKIITINLKLYNSLKSSQNKLYILKYIFSKYRDLTELANKEELFKIFIDYSSHLIDLLRQMISTNNKNLEYILQNKNISIDIREYKKLQDYSTQLHLFELTNILTIYESLDYMLDNKVDIVNSNSGELWD